MKLYQIVIDYSKIPAAWKTPLTSEVYGPFRAGAVSEAQVSEDYRACVRSYGERCGVSLDSGEYAQALHVENREYPGVPVEDLNEGYHLWHNFDRAFINGKLNVEKK